METVLKTQLFDLLSGSISKRAIIHHDEILTYAKLRVRVHTKAQDLIALGVEKGDIVAVLSEKSIDLVVTLLAINKAGGVAIPLNTHLKTAQLQAILNQAGVDRLILSGLQYGLHSTLTAPCIHPLKFFSPNTAYSIVGDRFPTVTETDLAMVFYTSGSLSHPKGVQVTNRNLLAGAESVSQYLRLDGDDVVLAALPLYFDAGFSQLTTAFSVGATVVLHDIVVPVETQTTCDQWGVTAITGVPSMFNLLLSRTTGWTNLLRPIKIIATTGESVTPDLYHKLKDSFPTAQLNLMYGLTESFRCSYVPPSWPYQMGCIGLPIPGTDLSPRKESGAVCDTNEIGELVATGALVAKGYHRHVDDKTFRENGLGQMEVWTGDLGYRREDGLLQILGRRDTSYKVAGYRVFPEEIEQIINLIPGVQASMVIPLDDEFLGHASKAFIVCDDKISKTWIYGELSKRCPDYMIPTQIETLSELPLLPNWKRDYRTLKERDD